MHAPGFLALAGNSGGEFLPSMQPMRLHASVDWHGPQNAIKIADSFTKLAETFDLDSESPEWVAIGRYK
jgi:hypothetical protein